MTGPLLRVESVTKRFGGLTAVCAVDLTVPCGQIAGLIGPNGAGKTSLFNAITGLSTASSGRIELCGVEVTRARPDQIVKAGINRTFQNIRLWRSMTAEECVLVGLHSQTRTGLLRAIVRSPNARREQRAARRRAAELLSYVGIPMQLHHVRATSLSYGHQRRVEIARALASAPKLLLLDEPSAGMNASESAALVDLMGRLRDDRDLSILLIEHDMRVVMSACEQITVLDHGQVIAHGVPEAVRNDARVIEAYLGRRRAP